MFVASVLLLGLGLHALKGEPLAVSNALDAPHLASGLASMGAASKPVAVLTLGLFVLICLPVARVALTLLHFAREGDRFSWGGRYRDLLGLHR
jgi:uncharacterized membrane protein